MNLFLPHPTVLLQDMPTLRQSTPYCSGKIRPMGPSSGVFFTNSSSAGSFLKILHPFENMSPLLLAVKYPLM
jgi:hypothetical protein